MEFKCTTAVVILSVSLFISDVISDVCQQRLCICDNKTGFVNCSRNGLTGVPAEIPLNTTDLDLSMNNLHKISSSAFKKFVNLTSIDLSSNMIGINGLEAKTLDLPKLVTVDLSYNNMTSFPRSVLPKSLTKLYFMQNYMPEIDASAFVDTPSLEYLDLSNNLLKRIPPGLLSPLKNLSTLYIPFNKLTNFRIPDDTFMENKKLTLLSARFNLLDQILPNLPVSLQDLDYAGNKIKVIPEYAFKSLPNLKGIALWMGRVEVLEENAFSGLTNLQYLDMSSNNITSNITKTMFAGLTNLKSLVMYLNNVSYIEPSSFSSFKNVTEIWLADNELKTLNPTVFDVKMMPHLSEVYIDGNPWYCDCHLKWLKQMSERHYSIIQDVHLIVCNGPERLKNKSFDQLSADDFVCN